jgi:hypothetical protein
MAIGRSLTGWAHVVNSCSILWRPAQLTARDAQAFFSLCIGDIHGAINVRNSGICPGNPRAQNQHAGKNGFLMPWSERIMANEHRKFLWTKLETRYTGKNSILNFGDAGYTASDYGRCLIVTVF